MGGDVGMFGWLFAGNMNDTLHAVGFMQKKNFWEKVSFTNAWTKSRWTDVSHDSCSSYRWTKTITYICFFSSWLGNPSFFVFSRRIWCHNWHNSIVQPLLYLSECICLLWMVLVQWYLGTDSERPWGPGLGGCAKKKFLLRPDTRDPWNEASEWNHLKMGVSNNRCTPKSSILIGFSIIDHPFWGTPIFGNTQMDGWNTIVSFWGVKRPIFRGELLLSVSVFCGPYPPWN